mmetsp:Transcript_10421/g.23600  ORF Transcript_10421/g.23600 Transcript_10421/m.23600 type:complete len:233 (+) Transcript_10421:79-777(+)
MVSSDEDLSPPRAAPASSSNAGRAANDEDGDISPPRQQADKKKLLVLGAEMKKPEKRTLNAEEADGKNAATVYRDRGSGKTISREEWVQNQQKKKRKKLSDYPEQELEWGGGVKQTANQEAEKAELERIAAQPFARYAPDEKYMDELKERSDWNDPMKNYDDAKAKKKEAAAVEKPKPKCRHPAWPNRFNILPGYRWDGKVRGNGYEVRWLENKAHREWKQDAKYYYENLEE